MTLRAGLTLLGIALIFGLGFHFGGLRSEARLSDYKAKVEKALAEAVRREAEASEHARTVERASQAKADRLAEAYEKDKQNAADSANRIIGDLRSGLVQLRQQWKGAEATNRLARDSEAARHADELAQLREQGARDLVRIGAEADAQVRGLQEYAREVSK